MGKILTKNDKEIIDFFNRIQDLKKILKSLKTDQLRSLFLPMIRSVRTI